MITGLEIKRKIVHLASLVIPLGYCFMARETVLTWVVLICLGFLFVDVLRHFHPGMALLFQRYFIGTVLREKENHTLMASTYFLISTCMVIFFFPKSIAIASILILIISDTCAAWVGRGLGKVRLLGKTLEGSTAFLLSSLAIVWSYPGLDGWAGSVAAVGATLVEILPLPVDDNLTIPLVAASLMFFVGA